MAHRFVTAALVVALGGFTAAGQAQARASDDELEQLEEKVRRLEQRVQELEAEGREAREETDEIRKQLRTTRELAEQAVAKAKQPVEVGGAVRVQYAYRDFNEVQTERDGSFELDTIRVNFDGEIGQVLLSAEYRFYEFMDVVHHAWFGYAFSDTWRVQLGMQQVPFGLLPYSSNNFFFGSNYYLGYEDDYDAGVKLIGAYDLWNFQLAYYANDEITFGARNERYSYDVLRDNSGNRIEEDNTLNARITHMIRHSETASTEIGASLQYGSLADDGSVDDNDPATPERSATGRSVGDNQAGALHVHGAYGPWSVMLQALRYEYDLDNDDRILGVGAYAFDDAIPAEAYSYTANLAYDWPTSLGPITHIRFYNDFSYVTDKSGGLPGTWMNVLGAAISAGGLFTYVDLVHARNQPFIGGSLAGDGAFALGPGNRKTVSARRGGDEETRFNINFGYYF